MNGHRLGLAIVLSFVATGPARAAAVIEMATARLTIGDPGYAAGLEFAGGARWPAAVCPALDISWHKAIAFRVHGDGLGGQLKLQLREGKGAMDYYVPNKYVGWRYHQLLRPQRDPIDYHRVSSLTFYYNGLPAKKKVACAIDDVKALRSVDEPVLVDPYVKIAGRRCSARPSYRRWPFA
jgi:hypothetical protein